MAISYTQQRTNVPASVAQLSSSLGRSNEPAYVEGMVPPSSDLLVRLWSVIQRLEDEVDVERERNRTLTTQVDSLTDHLATSNTLLATLSGMSTTSGLAGAPPTAFPSTVDSNVPVVALSGEASSTDSWKQRQHLLSSPPSTAIGTTFPDHGVPLWHVLRSLSNIDEKRVFTVRKIQKLGFESPPKLREYFSLWGRVTNIMVLHRQARTTSSSSSGDMSNDKNVRVRPPSVGFVVMEDPEVVTRILATPQHTICGHSCEVQVFERKHRHATNCESLLSETSSVSSPARFLGTNMNVIKGEELPDLRSGSMRMVGKEYKKEHSYASGAASGAYDTGLPVP
ncbi:hypothetical protein Pmar_PMAR007349 [Perkinsus marinus ATCC 50983]|uniref:RRM domain-containing protein n=1 Tax=Perkinsus marinus (strain ATCC 50983 / TXsc) TaxID=423536 RepID=C5K636_PERM5|nr:hypothetical protein Pmar_PMAR007349 [Perkinsus marinus ATCC 50983]EER20066.1 hypothetical protein Pmar_PMAR007349 [Perkinsus marinus ATCC 50983]|eukprot:XP_002788270.1 hypothetical protein Pmar_PMAR007349 [Perkinsus marinus ATCC 50983]